MICAQLLLLMRGAAIFLRVAMFDRFAMPVYFRHSLSSMLIQHAIFYHQRLCARRFRAAAAAGLIIAAFRRRFDLPPALDILMLRRSMPPLFS